MNLVEIRGLRVSFGDVHAVHDLSLTATAGQALALVGRNGAGKSTTLRVLAGVHRADEGTVLVLGHDARRDPLAVKSVTGYCPDVGGLLPRATPWEHLQLAARLRELVGWQDRARDLLERFDLADAADRVTAGFSHGMSRRLSVVLAALHRPSVLLLDEPFDGVDPLGVEATLELVREAQAEGSAVLISTHQIELAAQACDTAMILRGGLAVATYPAEELLGTHGAARYRAALAG